MSAVVARRKPGPAKGFGFWTSERIASAATMWWRDSSAAAIAKHHGASDSSTKAMMARNREQFPTRGDLLKQTGMKHPGKGQGAKVIALSPAPKPTAPAEQPVVRDHAPKAESFRPLPGVEPMPVLSALIANRCKWPVHTGDDPFSNAATFFCGEQRLNGKPYCTGHQLLAHSSGTPSERSADRVMEYQAGRGG